MLICKNGIYRQIEPRKLADYSAKGYAPVPTEAPQSEPGEPPAEQPEPPTQNKPPTRKRDPKSEV